MGSPSIFVYDCSNAGLIVKSFKQFALQREQELEVRPSRPRTGADCPVSPRLGGGRLRCLRALGVPRWIW